MTIKTRILVVFLGGVALILVILALQLLAPGDKLEQAGADDAQIVFYADQEMVVAPGACLTVRWQVEHIRAVYFDNLPTVSPGFKQICVDNETMPVLHIEFQDGTAQDYTLETKFLVEQPSTWLLGWVGVLLLLASVCIAVRRPSAAFAILGSLRHTSRLVVCFAGIGMLFSGIVVIALPLELGLRFYFGQFGTQDEKSAYLRSHAEIVAAQSDLITLPFVGYAPSPDFPGHNRLGYRGDDIQVPKPAGVYRIVVLGDSSTYGISVPYDKTYPADLQQVLRDNYGYKKLDVVNGGVPLYTSWNFLMNLAFRVPELQPDLVIVYPGWNDLTSREQSPDCYHSPSPFLGLSALWQASVQPADLSPSALYRLLTIGFGWTPAPSPQNEVVTYAGIHCSPQITSEIPQNLQTNPPIYFERNLREMIGVAQAMGIKIMFMTWAYNPKANYVPEFRLPGVVEQNAIIARIAQENGALFFDYAAVASMDKESWADVAHVSVRGSLEQAQKIARFLVDHGVITQ